MRKIIAVLGSLVLGIMMIALSGCMTVDSTGRSPSGGVTSPGVPRSQKGVYHKVQKKETLWRIAKTYGVDIDDIIRSNNIPNGAHLEENQLIFIPGADSVKDIDVPLQTTRFTATSLSASYSASKMTMTGPVKDDFGWPVPGRVARGFGSPGTYLNRGIAIETQEGQPVVASRQGKVVFADYLAGYYYTVVLDHLDGYYTVYGFNSKLAVGLGDVIAKGDKVAFAGRKGATPLLYFEIRRNAKAENPLYFLPKS